MSDTQKTGYAFKVLPEQVAEEDMSEGKTHQKVADNLFRLIEQTEEGLTIGLEGGWGSGKSTVVALLRKQFEAEDKKTLFFLFDAWAHEGDPLRRVFLESLIEAMDPEGRDTELKGLCEEIAGRKKTTKIVTTKKPFALGVWLSVAALFVPVGVALLSSAELDKAVWYWSAQSAAFDPVATFGLLFSCLPIFVAVVWVVCCLCKGKKIDLSLLHSESTETCTQNISEESERTSVEFEGFFKKILESRLGKDKQYQCAIIVVDNLDRISAEHARNAWAALQAFFQHRSGVKEKPEWMKKLWFLVPYDRDGMAEIWKSDSERPIHVSQPEPSGALSMFMKGSLDDEGVAASFLNKCFQIKAEVPELIMSGWADYLQRYVSLALADWLESDRKAVIRTYSNQMARLDKSPTPREVRGFINQVGLLGMQWGGEVPAESMAVYAHLRMTCSDRQMRTRLLNPGGLNVSACNDPDKVVQDLAGLLFAVPGEKGMQLLLRDPIWKGMSKEWAPEDAPKPAIRDLIALHGEGFWIAWNATKDSLMPGSTHSQEHLIALINNMHAQMGEYPEKIALDARRLHSVFTDPASQWDMDRFDYVKPASALIELIDNQAAVMEKFNRCFFVWFRKAFKDSRFEENLIKKIRAGFLFLESNQSNLEYNDKNPLLLDTDRWVEWSVALNALNVDVPMVGPATGVISGISEKLHERSGHGAEARYAAAYLALKVNPDSREWRHFIEKCWIQPQVNSKSNNYLNLVGAICSCASDSAVLEYASSRMRGGRLWTSARQLAFAKNQSLFVLMAVVFGKTLQVEEEMPEAIKAFYNDESNADSLVRALKDADLRVNFWSVAADPFNKAAVLAMSRGVGLDRRSDADVLEFFGEVAKNPAAWPERSIDSIIGHLPEDLAVKAAALLDSVDAACGDGGS